jgi:PAS domain S-box-containing protein
VINLFRFVPIRSALLYIVPGALVFLVSATLLWYAWRAHLSTFQAYVQGEDLQRLAGVFEREGASGLATWIDSQVRRLGPGEILVFADPAKRRLAGNLPEWPAEVPDAAGTYGLVVSPGDRTTLRVVASHIALPGGYHLLVGRESSSFESLGEHFWYGIAGTTVVILLLGAVIGWMIMLEQLARQNARLEGEAAVRRQAEQALRLVQDDLEGLVAQRTTQLAQANASLRRSEAYLAEAQRLSQTGSWAFDVGTRQIVHASPECFRIFGFDPEQGMPSFDMFRQRVHPEDQAGAAEVLERAGSDGTGYELDFRVVLPDGAMRYIHAIGHPVFDASGDLLEFVGTVIDVTERKQADAERHTHLVFLEGMEKISRAMQGGNDLEQMMSDVLDATVSIFECDRAWLMYPCDPDAASATVTMLRGRPEVPAPVRVGQNRLVDAERAALYRTALASTYPVTFGPGGEHPLPEGLAKEIGISSRIMMALYPKGDRPYLFGLSRGSHGRAWTPREGSLFQEIGRRLEDALTSLLIFRRLGESERKLEEAQRISHVGHWERDLATDRYTWSDETYRILGLRPKERILGFGQMQQLVHPADRQMRATAVAKALQGGPRYDVEYRTVRPDGEVRFVRSQADVVRDEAGRARRMFGTIQDITDRKRAEQRLVTQHSVTQILAEAPTLEHATPGVLRAVCECLGWDLGALWNVGREAGVLRCVEVWHQESVEVPQFEATSRQMTFTVGVGLPGRVWSSREPMYVPDLARDPTLPRAPIAAREGLHAAFGFPILVDGDVSGVIEFFSREIRHPDQDLLDMTVTIGGQIGQFIERKRAEEALRRVQAELAHVTRVATLGELTGSIAHEINQPLGAVVNNAGACLRWLAAHNLEEARQSAARVIADGHRASEIVGRIRALAKKAPPRKEWLDLNDTVRDVVLLAQSEVRENRVALHALLGEALPAVWGDRIQIQQVVLNLLKNAIEALSGVGEGPREVWVGTEEGESGAVVISVRDTGPGVAAESVDRLFEAFCTTKPGGLGMGLAISRSIVENHGGRLWATANVPRGAVFQFTLPTAREGTG